MRVLAAASRRYARALVDVAVAAGDPAAVRSGLDRAASLLAASAELGRVLTHPALPVERKKKIVAKIWGPETPALVRRLLELLVERQRVALLPAVARHFAALWNQQRGVVSVEAVAAVALSPEQQAALSRAVAQASGREVELSTTQDPGVLGGVLLRLEGRVLDGTVRGRLQALRARLQGRPAGA